MATTKALAQAIKTRDGLKIKLQWIQSSIITTATMAETQIEDFIAMMEQYLIKLDENFEAIHTNSDAADIPTHTTEYNTMMTEMMQVKWELQEAKKNLNPSQPPKAPSGSGQSDIRLPRIELPTFDGSLNEWTSFRDMFTTAIHSNTNLSKAQKLTYLKSRLIGEASRQVRSLSLTDSNYDIAWAQLHDRYQNERELLFAILRRFVSQPSVQPSSAPSIRSIIDISRECVRSLQVLKRPVEHWDDIMLFHIVQKLDHQSKELWEQSLKDSSIPPLKNLFDFLESRSRGLAASSGSSQGQKGQQHPGPARPNLNVRGVQAHHTQTQAVVCIAACPNPHPLYRCPKFLEMPIPEREELIKKSRSCYNCLKQGHTSSSCPLTGGCKICNNKHNTLLHKAKSQTAKVNQTTPSPDATTGKDHVSCHSNNEYTVQQSLLATATICIKDSDGVQHTCRALLDNGSTASFITEQLVRRLGLRYSKSNASVSGLSSTAVATTKGTTQISISPHFNPNECFNITTFMLPKITGKLPSYLIDPTVWPHLTGLQLADPNFHQPSDIDILLGADIFWTILLEGKKNGPPNSPVAFRSIFGWLIAGGSHYANHPQIKVHHADLDLDRSLRRFWEIETISTAKPLTKEEKLCEDHFASTHKRLPNGQYVVQIPFKEPMVPLGSSRDIASRRLLQLERRFVSNPKIKTEYVKFMDEYLALGHMEEVPSNEVSHPKHPTCFLTHHPVEKLDSTTTKLRVVFNASAATTSGYSLNDTMMVGPPLQDTLVDIMSRFRLHPVAFTADIEKMYRKILVTPANSDLQRILWRRSPSEPIKEYRLLTVTYGTASAPYLATKVIQQLAKDEEETFPLGSRAALRDLFVDDAMTGGPNESQAIEIQRQLIGLTDQGGLHLRKFSSNSEALMKAVPEERRETNILLPVDDDQTVKTLGVFWNTSKDVFQFKLSNREGLPKVQSNHTKRQVTSEVAKLFDPLGWLAPVIISGKIFIQDLWKLQLCWDSKIPDDQQQQFVEFQNNLPSLEQLRIPRCIVPEGAVSYDLAGFSDASEKAYSAVVYLCTTFPSGSRRVELITSKTRVAPVKQLSLPRLELCGASLLVNLISNVTTSLKLDIQRVDAFTDSTIVLAWLASPPTRWKTFVANRVSEIQELVPGCHWHHVSGLENPADCASRGITPQELIEHPLWWNGPSWLSSGSYPAHELTPTFLPSDLEEKPIKISCNLASHDLSTLSNYNSLSKLLRETAWILRFVHNTRVQHQINNKLFPVNQKLSGSLTPLELDHSLLYWVRLVQQQSFPEEIHSLTNGMSVSHKSKILPLSPFMDEFQILRVGGRLSNAPVPELQKHPILLPRHHALTKLIIEYEHLRNLHAGPQLLVSILSRRFWILRCRDAVRQQVRKCVRCTRFTAETQQQMMGNLPSSRVSPGRPFQECGVDYAGPFSLRPLLKRSKVTIKAYIAIFICFKTRAIHLELVSSLDTPSFLASLRRFVSRRGPPSVIHSDCGTNFVGAAKELKEMMSLIKNQVHNQQIQQQISMNGIKWEFNAPGAPHFGGLWEAGVKSLKYHLRRTVGAARLTFEEMTTVLTQIEACLNSRPLTPMQSDPSDLAALTPAYFLIGGPLVSIPEPNLTTLKEGRLSNWQHLQQITQHFWKRWSREYITRLQQKPKWLKQKDDLKIGSMVLVKDECLPPLFWKLGRIKAVHPGNDGRIRVVTIKTEKGEIQRPIVKVCLLPVDCPNESEINTI